MKIIKYILCGGLTTVVNMVVFIALDKLSIHYIVSTSLAWLLAVIFAYITNKLYVFKTDNKKPLVKEIVSFFSVRVFSLITDIIVTSTLIEVLCIENICSKLIANIIIIILNYVLSLKFVFK